MHPEINGVLLYKRIQDKLDSYFIKRHQELMEKKQYFNEQWEKLGKGAYKLYLRELGTELDEVLAELNVRLERAFPGMLWNKPERTVESNVKEFLYCVDLLWEDEKVVATLVTKIRQRLDCFSFDKQPVLEIVPREY